MIQKEEESDQVHNLSRGLELAIERRRSAIGPHVQKIKFNFGEFDPSRISPPRDLECSVNESCNRILYGEYSPEKPSRRGLHFRADYSGSDGKETGE